MRKLLDDGNDGGRDSRGRIFVQRGHVDPACRCDVTSVVLLQGRYLHTNTASARCPPNTCCSTADSTDDLDEAHTTWASDR